MVYQIYSKIRKLMVVISMTLVGSIVSGCSDSADITNNVAVVPEIGAASENFTESFAEIDTTPTIGAENCLILDGIGNTSSIAGLYDTSEENNIIYTQIGSSGKVTVYDYQQDEIGQGDNCYLILDGHSAISPLENERYFKLSYADLDFSCQTGTSVLTITRTQNLLTISYPDSNDEDGDGDFFDTLIKTHPVLSSLSVEAFNRCE